MTSPPWAEFDELFHAFAVDRHAPGLVAGAVIDGELAHGYVFADPAAPEPVTINHRFRIASMSKSFAAIAVLSLRDSGKLHLDTPVGELVPELTSRDPLTADSAPVTVRDLVHHLGGDVTDDPWADRLLGITPDDFSASLSAGWPAARPSGTAFGYSNLGYALLGRVIQAASGVPYQSYVGELLFRQLGMTETTYDFHDVPQALLARPHRWTGESLVAEELAADGEFGVMGGIITTIADFAKYVGFILDAWPARDHPQSGPVRRSTLRELAIGYGHPRMIDQGRDAPQVPGVYGAGLITQFDPDLGTVIQHSGGLPGYGSNFMMCPDLGASVFSFSNVTYAAPIVPNRAAAKLLLDTGLIAPRPLESSPALTLAAEAAISLFETSDFTTIAKLAAPNLFADVPVDERARSLAELREKYGEQQSHVVEPEHRLAGKVVLTCASGDVVIDLRLAPTPEPLLQALVFSGR